MFNKMLDDFGTNKFLTEPIQFDVNQPMEDFIELMDLFCDLILEVKKRASEDVCKVSRYEVVLGLIQAMFAPQKAYEAGLASTQEDFGIAFMQYLNSISSDPMYQRLILEMTLLHNEILIILDVDIGNAKQLLVDFTELHRICCGFAQKNIHVFFKYGYANRK